MGLGDKVAVSALTDRAIAVVSIKKDVLEGPTSIEILARVSTQMGEPDRAIASLQKLLSTVRRANGCERVPHSCPAPPRSNVRSASE